MRIGQPVHNVEKVFNTLHVGFHCEDDFPPPRLMEEPIKKDPYKGEVLHREKWEQLLDNYYDLHGWDKKTSWQTRQGIRRLGLEDVAEKLDQAGKLID